MEDYFARGHLPEFDTSLCVRVTVTDDRTGRMALLWSTKKDSAYLTEAPLAYWEPYLTEGAISGGWMDVLGCWGLVGVLWLGLG